MSSRDFAREINAHHHRESPAQRDVGEAAVDGLARILGGKQRDHGNHSVAQQDEHKSSQELRDQLRC